MCLHRGPINKCPSVTRLFAGEKRKRLHVGATVGEQEMSWSSLFTVMVPGYESSSELINTFCFSGKRERETAVILLSLGYYQLNQAGFLLPGLLRSRFEYLVIGCSDAFQRRAC